MMESSLKSHNIEYAKDTRENMMNSNRVIEPFSPTFEHPDDFLPSNQTSYRPLAMAKYGMNLDKQYKRKDMKEHNKSMVPVAIFNCTGGLDIPDSKGTRANHNRTQSSHTDTIDYDRHKNIRDIDAFRETGKFVNPLSETSEVTTKQKATTKRLADSKESTLRSKRRAKTGNGRYSRRSKGKNKSEERKDNKRIFSKSVDQSYHLENSSVYPHDLSIIKKLTRVAGEDLLSAEEAHKSLVSPHNKINKLIRESLKKKKESETIKIIEQILKEEDHLLK